MIDLTVPRADRALWRLYSLLVATCLWLSQPLMADAVHITGQAVQGGMMVAKAPPGSQATLNGQAIPVSEFGFFVFGFGKDDTEPSVVAVFLPNGALWQQSIQPKARVFPVQQIDGLEPSRVTPPPEVTQRIAEEAQLASQAREIISPLTGFAESFIWPVEGRLTGVYGAQRILNGEPRAPHWGVDIAAPTGTPVVSPASGQVVLVHEDMYFSGGTVFIDHGHGVLSSFLHLEEILVPEGTYLRKGEAFATVGSTGRSTGPHLDWRISWGQIRLDAQLLVDPLCEHC